MIWLPVVGSWSDIDVYASILAYSNLLNQRGKVAKTYFPAAPNYSVPEELRIKELENFGFDLKPTDEVIILDISTPEIINRLVPDNQIIELIDHHPGYEDYWHGRLGDKAIIEKIGAVATSVFEWWGECWDYGKMSPEIAKLLLAAILDNTLNFNADITTERDRKAAEQLASIAKTSVKDFARWYFGTVSKTIVDDLSDSLLGDIKMVDVPVVGEKIAFGQLALWDAQHIFKNRAEIIKTMDEKYDEWLVSVLNISEKQNYILAATSQIDDYFIKLLELKNNGEWSISNQLYLRKEIMAKVLEKSA